MGFIKRLDFFDKLAVILTFLFVLAGSIVSILRFWQYETFYYDFGIFDRAIWEVSHFRPPIIDHLVVSGKWILADHFNPSIFLLSPLYYLTNKQEVLLIAQALAVGLSGLVIYLIGKEVLRNKFASLSILISYFLFLGLQNAVISDFHEVTIATLPLALTFWAIINKKVKWFIIFGLLALGFKESNFILGAAIGIFIMLFDKSWFKIGLSTIVFSLTYGFLVIKFVIPYFSGGAYAYSEPLNFSPLFILQTIINNQVKINTIFYSFFSFGFLPLFSPVFLILIFQDFLVRFYSDLGSTRINLGLHYSALLSVIMAVASIYGLKKLFRRFSNGTISTILTIVIILNSLFLYRFILHGPFALSYNPDFYKHTSDFKFLNQLVSKVPNPPAGGVSVMAQNNIASHFTHQKVWILRMNYGQFSPDYVLLDARPEQNPNNFFGEAGFNVNNFLEKINADKSYKLIYKADYQYIFKKT